MLLNSVLNIFCRKLLRLKLKSLTFKEHIKVVLLNKIKVEQQTNLECLNLMKVLSNLAIILKLIIVIIIITIVML